MDKLQSVTVANDTVFMNYNIAQKHRVNGSSHWASASLEYIA